MGKPNNDQFIREINHMLHLKSVMLHRNSNTPIIEVVGTWDKKRNIGMTCIEIREHCSYVPYMYVDKIFHPTVESMDKEYSRLQEKVYKYNLTLNYNRDLECEQKALLSCYKRTKSGIKNKTIILPVCNLNLMVNEGKAQYAINVSIDDLELTNYEEIYLDITNDPTPTVAGGCISLGYYVLRMHFFHAKIVQKNPITIIEFDFKDYDCKHCRPCRRPY